MRKSVTNAKHPVAAFFHLFFKVRTWYKGWMRA